MRNVEPSICPPAEKGRWEMGLGTGKGDRGVTRGDRLGLFKDGRLGGGEVQDPEKRKDDFFGVGGGFLLLGRDKGA